MNIPSDLDLKTPTKINSLSRDIKKNYYLQLLRKILKANPDGMTSVQISKELNQLNPKYSYNYETLGIYLNQLVAMREAYTTTFGNATIFKYNGRLLHADRKNFFEKNGRSYHIIEIENSNLLGERFFLIQEREKSSFNVEKVVGGLLIPRKDMYEFLSALDVVAREVSVNEK